MSTKLTLFFINEIKINKQHLFCVQTEIASLFSTSCITFDTYLYINISRYIIYFDAILTTYEFTHYGHTHSSTSINPSKEINRNTTMGLYTTSMHVYYSAANGICVFLLPGFYHASSTCTIICTII